VRGDGIRIMNVNVASQRHNIIHIMQGECDGREDDVAMSVSCPVRSVDDLVVPQ